jgi:uncharacterized protein (DUF2235 family)
LPPGEGSREPHSQLYDDALKKLTVIFGEHLADVLARHRKVEAVTGERNVIGRQNLVEGLAHLGVLFARAPELDRDKQLEQVAFLGDHLRRVMMESFEVEAYVAIAALWDDETPTSIGRLYDSIAAPQIRAGKLHGHVSPDEVESRFDRLSDSIVSARRAKIADGDWSAWTTAADDIESAGEQIKVLKREMGAAVDAAKSNRSQRRMLVASIILSAALGAAISTAVQMLLT